MFQEISPRHRLSPRFRMASLSPSRNTMLEYDDCPGVLSICARGDRENRTRACERNSDDSELQESRLHTRFCEPTPTVASDFSDWTLGIASRDSAQGPRQLAR